jgi:hypothetical protein
MSKNSHKSQHLAPANQDRDYEPIRLFSLRGTGSKEYFERYKFLLLKIIEQPELPTEDEVLELSLLKLRLDDEADICFIRAHKVILRDLELLNDVLQQKSELSHQDKQLRAKKLIGSYQMKVKLNCAYFGKKVQAPPRPLLRTRLSTNQKERKVRKRYIGVGYKDHGTMRNIAIDGSPGWKEVCSKLYEEKEPRYSNKEMHMLGIFYQRFHRYWDKLEEQREKDVSSSHSKPPQRTPHCLKSNNDFI